MIVSLYTTNINAVNISTPDFRLWQFFNSNRTTPHLLMYLKFESHSSTNMINTSEPVHSFTFNKDDNKDPSLIWTMLMHPGTYIGTIGMIFTVCIVVYCFKRFWLRPDTPRHQTYPPVSSQHATVDDNVHAAPLYRSRGMVEEPRRLHRNHGLDIEEEATRLQSCCKQPTLLKGVNISWLLAPKAKIQGVQ